MSTELRPVRRTLFGTPEQVHNVLINADRRGHLVSAAPARRVAPNRVSVDLVLMEPAPIQPARPAEKPAERHAKPRFRRAPTWVVVGGVSALLAALAALVVALVALAQWVVAHAAVIGGAALVLAALLLGLRSKVGSGPHCPGAWHR